MSKTRQRMQRCRKCGSVLFAAGPTGRPESGEGKGGLELKIETEFWDFGESPFTKCSVCGEKHYLVESRRGYLVLS